jgi:hypothetical protein
MLCGPISNILVRASDFNMWGGANTNFGNVAIFGAGFNINVLENTFNGNTNLQPASFTNVSTNLYYNGMISAVGLVWLQFGGNLFVARNSISNYLYEGVNLNAGPNSVVGNTFQTLINNLACCAVNYVGGYAGGAWGGPGITNFENSTCIIGNSVYGGRKGLENGPTLTPYSYNFSGNCVTLYPPFGFFGEWPGTAAGAQGCRSASVCGNTLVAGGQGFWFLGANTNALILNNNFANASYRSVGYQTAADSLSTAQIFGNTLGDGVSFHVQLPDANSFGWFLGQNTFVDTNSNIVPAFLDPASSAEHTSN